MAQRRMFSPDIVNSDAFLEMPPSTQALYFQLGMKADDDGFVNPKMVMRMMGSSEDELRVLLGKRFVLSFENGVLVIKHWRVNNLVRKDWYKPTIYTEQKALLSVKPNGAYTFDTEQGIPLVNEPLTQVRLGKVNRESDASVVPSKKTYKEFRDLRRIESGREPMTPAPRTQSQKRAMSELVKLEPDIALYRSLALQAGFDYLELPEEANSKIRRQMLNARARFGEETQNFYRWIFTTEDKWPKKMNYHPESCITSIMFDTYKNRENKGNNSILKSWGV